MACKSEQNFCVSKGETFAPVLRWGGGVLTSKPITAIARAAPVTITAFGHGVPPGWQVAVVSAGGMAQINAKKYPPAARDWHSATVIDANTISLNDVSSASYSPYTSGGFLVYATPVDLTGMTAVMTIRAAPLTGAVLLTLTNTSGITLGAVNKTITPKFETAALAWSQGFYDLELTDSAGNVTQLLTGTITVN